MARTAVKATRLISAIGSMRVSQPTRPNGFTLIELMVVLVLIAVLSGVMVAEMRGTFEDSLLRSTARELMSTCALASSRAITVLQPHTLVIEPGHGRYAIERMVRDEQFGAAPRTIRDVDGGEGELDERISVEVRDPARSTEQPEDNARDELRAEAARPGAITFYPDGTADPREIILRDGTGVELKLQINRVTARIRVVEP